MRRSRALFDGGCFGLRIGSRDEEAEAEEAKIRAEKAMKEASQSSAEFAQVAAALERSLARINVARKHGHRKAPVIENN